MLFVFFVVKYIWKEESISRVVKRLDDYLSVFAREEMTADYADDD